jgi:hypothetical protein
MKFITVEISDFQYRHLMLSLAEAPKGSIAICIRRIVAIGPLPSSEEVLYGLENMKDILEERMIFSPADEAEHPSFSDNPENGEEE